MILHFCDHGGLAYTACRPMLYISINHGIFAFYIVVYILFVYDVFDN